MKSIKLGKPGFDKSLATTLQAAMHIGALGNAAAVAQTLRATLDGAVSPPTDLFDNVPVSAVFKCAMCSGVRDQDRQYCAACATALSRPIAERPPLPPMEQTELL